jgi:hypothetical protein
LLTNSQMALFVDLLWLFVFMLPPEIMKAPRKGVFRFFHGQGDTNIKFSG